MCPPAPSRVVPCPGHSQSASRQARHAWAQHRERGAGAQYPDPAGWLFLSCDARRLGRGGVLPGGRSATPLRAGFPLCFAPASSNQSPARDCPGQAVLQAWAAVTGPPPPSSWGQRLQEGCEGGVWAGSGEAGRKKVFQGPILEEGEQDQGRPGGSTGPASPRPGEKKAR